MNMFEGIVLNRNLFGKPNHFIFAFLNISHEKFTMSIQKKITDEDWPARSSLPQILHWG